MVHCFVLFFYIIFLWFNAFLWVRLPSSRPNMKRWKGERNSTVSLAVSLKSSGRQFLLGQRLKGWQWEHSTHPWAADWCTGNKETVFSLITNKHSEDTHGASVGSLVSSMRFHFAQNSGEITGCCRSRGFHMKNMLPPSPTIEFFWKILL